MKSKKNKNKNKNNSLGILIAEDSRTQADLLSFLLEEHGYRVTIAANGKQALEAAQAQKPTLIISDIMMPEMDGYELCKAIKSDEKLKDTPVILVTTLSDSQDVIRGLECGADNFIRKPYDERYLLSHIDYLLMNLELRKNQKMQMGVEIKLGGQKYFITSERQQILDLLISTYEQAVHINTELKLRETELAHSNQVLNGLYNIAAGLNHAITEREVAEAALELALELPGIQAGWISLRDGESGFRLAAARGLPPALSGPDAFNGNCTCRRKLLSGELDHVTNILECERLRSAQGDTQGLCLHASMPLWLGSGHNTLGVMNLAGPGDKLFDEEELKVLYNVGNQLAVALERARLHEHLEKLVEERTAKLKLFRTLLDNSIDAIEVLDPVTMRFLDMNETECRVLGYSREELLSMSAFDIDPSISADAEKMIRAQLQQSGRAQFETVHRRKDGSTFPVEISVTSVELDKPYLLSIARDITERKLMERDLRESEARYRRITEGLTDYQYTVRIENNRAVEATQNPACMMMTGYTAEEFAANPHLWIQMVVPEDRELVMKQVDQILAGKDVLPIEHRITRKNGEIRWISDTTILLRDASGKLLSYDGVIKDITQRKVNEAKIARLNRIYSVLSGINTTIVRVREEGELFKEACRIAVEHGGFIFAWIGKFDADSQQVTPVAQAGRDDGYLAQINLTSRENIAGNCPLIAKALTETSPVICNDIASDERMAAWRSEALNRGYRSVVVFPLILESRPVGVFVLYAVETGVFDEEEMRLLIEMASDISFALDHLKKEEKLDYLAYYDAITGLPNRALFYDRLGQNLHDTQSGEMLAVLAIDLERFRVINETFGRHAGDELLKKVAERLITMGIGADHLARISADCFAVVLSDIREVADIVHFLENHVTAALSEPFKLEGKELHISAKAGIAIFPGDGKDADTLFRNAEAALKKSKLSSDKYLFYTPEFNARVAEKLILENKLRQALEQEQLVLHYQPKIDLKNNQIGGLEALMRWNDPETGLVPPWKFIPLLEETGMIIEAGAWALAQAMADYRDLQKKNLSPPRIAVNVSQVQLQRNDFVSTIERVLSDSGGVPDGLEIEITESLIMQDVEANIQKLRAIREMGVEVTIDDFGTGYSSLSYIAKLPISALKIDRAFIINMAGNSDDLSIVSAIISLAHSLNLRVIAEGVETNEQAKLLRLLKCDEIQGFLFSPGVPVAQIEEFLRNKKSL